MIIHMLSPFAHDSVHYPGGKGLSFRHIINLMPPHERYIETHLGGGAVMRHKRPARENIGIELDERVVGLWQRRGLGATTVVRGCVLEVLPTLCPDGDTLIYSDPPYPVTARRSRRYYRHDYDEADHLRLLELLKTVPAMVVISGYECGLYDEALSGWHRTTYQTRTHQDTVTEIAWTNFEPGSVLHDYRFVGTTFRERERFRRRTGRLAGELGRAADLELNAALATLGEQRPDALLEAARRLR